jgi:hypothetical protein
MLRVADGKELEANFDKQVAALPPYISAAEDFFLCPIWVLSKTFLDGSAPSLSASYAFSSQ